MSSAFPRVPLLVISLLLAACEHMPSEPVVEVAEEPVAQQCDCPIPEPVQPECPPVPEPSPPPVCPTTPVAVTKPFARATQGLQLIGRVENVFINADNAPNNVLKLKARIDTGAGLTSMHGLDLVEFERDGEPWVRFAMLQRKTDKRIYFERPVKRFINIKEHDGNHQRRPVVLMSFTLGDTEERVEVSITDRSEYLYQVLVGRNYLRDRAVVDVRRKFIADDGYYLDE